MAYTSKRERERAAGLMLLEAEVLVRRVCDCGPDEARELIIDAIVEGRIPVLFWDNRSGIVGAAAPANLRNWYEIELDWERSQIQVDHEYIKPPPEDHGDKQLVQTEYNPFSPEWMDPDWRPDPVWWFLLLDKAAVEALWPAPGAEPTTEQEEQRDTAALRGRAARWLARYVARGQHVGRDATLKAMADEFPALSKTGCLTIFQDYSRAHPDLGLSKRGQKLKRPTDKSKR